LNGALARKAKENEKKGKEEPQELGDRRLKNFEAGD
jgi:hypothetical protein